MHYATPSSSPIKPTLQPRQDSACARAVTARGPGARWTVGFRYAVRQPCVTALRGQPFQEGAYKRVHPDSGWPQRGRPCARRGSAPRSVLNRCAETPSAPCAPPRLVRGSRCYRGAPAGSRVGRRTGAGVGPRRQCVVMKKPLRPGLSRNALVAERQQISPVPKAKPRQLHGGTCIEEQTQPPLRRLYRGLIPATLQPVSAVAATGQHR
eukprot:scaffold347_cov380-Prasinococcus_capsulatus_cf.AAC.4